MMIASDGIARGGILSYLRIFHHTQNYIITCNNHSEILFYYQMESSCSLSKHTFIMMPMLSYRDANMATHNLFIVFCSLKYWHAWSVEIEYVPEWGTIMYLKI